MFQLSGFYCNPKALRTHVSRLLGPTTTLCRVFWAMLSMPHLFVYLDLSGVGLPIPKAPCEPRSKLFIRGAYKAYRIWDAYPEALK